MGVEFSGSGVKAKRIENSWVNTWGHCAEIYGVYVQLTLDGVVGEVMRK